MKGKPSQGNGGGAAVVPIDEAIAEIRAGRMVILMDDEDRENEGDLCLAAEKATPEAINFMARFGRGLICLALTEGKLAELGLPMMVPDNRARFGTAFAVSIDARRGIVSGVSAAERAATILTAVRDGAGPRDIVTPGHIFPLKAQPGGVLVRTGQTEGAVDLARLAGLKPAGVICEIMNDDGTMARLPDLRKFGAAHDLKICTVADLIQYRLRHESLVRRVGEASLPSRYGGEFRAAVYRSEVNGSEHLVLYKGRITPEEPTLVRVHAEYLPGDVFGYASRDTGRILHWAMEAISEEGKGVILYLRRAGKPFDLIQPGQGDPREEAQPSTDPETRLKDFRDYGIGAQILRDVGVGKIKLLTYHPRRLVSLPGYGLEVVEAVPLRSPGDTAGRASGRLRKIK